MHAFYSKQYVKNYCMVKYICSSVIINNAIKFILHYGCEFDLGFFNQKLATDLLKECSRMTEFDHPNVLTLIGVCLDGGPAPYIVMPFMFHGSLLSYLSKNRKELLISPMSDADEGTVSSYECNMNHKCKHSLILF